MDDIHLPTRAPLRVAKTQFPEITPVLYKDRLVKTLKYADDDICSLY